MKAKELRTQEEAELNFQLKEARKRMFELRFKVASEEISNTKELRGLRREVARILTVQNERRRNPAAAPSARPASKSASTTMKTKES